MNGSQRRFVPHSQSDSHSRFVSHNSGVSRSRPAYPPYRSDSVRQTVPPRPLYQPRQTTPVRSSYITRQSASIRPSRPVRQPIPERSSHSIRQAARVRSAYSGRSVRQPNRYSYWFPIITMVASLFFAVYAVVPRSLFGAFASDNRMYTVSISSGEGAFSITLTGDSTTDINLAGDEAVKTVNADDGTVTYALDLSSDLTRFDISSRNPISHMTFGEGADAVTTIDASGSGLSGINVSYCTALESLTVADCPIESDLSGIAYAEHENQCIHLSTPVFSYGESGALFSPNGFAVDSELTVRHNQKTLKTVDGKYCIPYAALQEALREDTTGSASVEIVNAAQPGLIYSFCITLHNVSDSDILNPRNEENASGGNADQSGDDTQNGKTENQGGKTDSQNGKTENQGGKTDSQNGKTDTQDGKTEAQGGKTNAEGGKSESNSVELTVDDGSKSVIKSAKVHDGTVFSVDGTEHEAAEFKIVAEAASAEKKAEFLTEIKKTDKNFNAEDKNLMVYDVYVVYTDGTKAAINGKVDFTLAFPNDTVKKNYDKYTYGVYHQKADKSVDTQQKAVGGKEGITVTTDSFSLFAVTAAPKPSNSDNPKTGDAPVALNIAFLLAMLSMVSFAAVYAKNKAEQV